MRRAAKRNGNGSKPVDNGTPGEAFRPTIAEPIGIHIGVPSRGLVRAEWAVSLKSLVEPVNMSWGVRLVVGESLEQARNTIVLDAQQGGGAKYVFFLDDDMLVPQQALRTLAYLMEQHDDWDLLTCVNVTKTTPAVPTIYADRTSGPMWDWKFGDVFPIHSCGLAATLVRLSAFDRLAEPWFRGDERSNTECDLDFCARLGAVGGTLMAHGGMLTGHVDNAGKVYALPRDSKPIMRALEAGDSELASHVLHGADG